MEGLLGELKKIFDNDAHTMITPGGRLIIYPG
jgi:hypothetical protein